MIELILSIKTSIQQEMQHKLFKLWFMSAVTSVAGVFMSIYFHYYTMGILSVATAWGSGLLTQKWIHDNIGEEKTLKDTENRN